MIDAEISLDAKVPDGPLAEKWDRHRAELKLVSPNNKRKLRVAVVGTGLAGASAAASLAELGYQVDAFTFHDSPRRAHSIAAQGGINAAKNYQNDGDSVWRLFYDTLKGGFSLARSQRVSTRSSEQQHHRSVCRAGCPVCSRVRWAACQSVVRRSPSFPHV